MTLKVSHFGIKNNVNNAKFDCIIDCITFYNDYGWTF